MAKLSLSTAACAVMVGISPLLWLSAIPGNGVSGCVLLGGILLLVVCRGWQWRALGVVLISLAWGLFNAHGVLESMMALEGRTVRADVTITEIRLSEHQDRQLRVRVEKIDGKWLFPAFDARLSIPDVMAAWCGGQRWQITTRFRPIHSRLNEGGFDSQRWGVAKRLLFSARVTQAQPVNVDCGARQRLITRIDKQAASVQWHAVLLALAFGEMKTFTPETHLLLQQTGTMHLMVISGLHIVLAAMFGWGALRGLQRLLPLRGIGYRIPLLFGGITAWGYVWLAGENPPAVRAALAFSVWMLIRWQGLTCSAWQVWLWCVALILASEPLMIISSSFWLSCVAVASLIFWFQWAPLPARYRQGWQWSLLRLAHLQCGIMLLLMPLQWSMFNGISPLSLPANLWAVPLVSFITAPLVLVALPLVPFPALSHGLWWLADRSIQGVFQPLTWLRHGWITLDETWLYASFLGWVGVILWRFAWWKAYPTTLLAGIAFIVLQRLTTVQPEWRLDMLDVGHGLAVIIERQGKVIIYDTGNRWEGGSMAQSEILPYLRWRGITPEAVILSHSHMDHIGGLEILLQAYPDLVVYSPFNHAGHRACVRGEAWQWRGLSFTALWPPQPVDYAHNDDSCVVRIDDGTRRILLTGDIERAAERQLVAMQREALAADLLQIPHHGSRTSSTLPLLRAVNPRYALASTGRYNPWRLPSREVVRRYRQQGHIWIDTALSGQVSVRFFSDKWYIKRYRQQLSPRWYHQWFGVPRDNE